MSNNTTTFQFKLEDGGSTKQTLNDFKQINAEADKLKNKAGGLFNKGMGRGAVAAAYKQNNDEGNEYGTARGTIGTGAAGRDFAKQSQGLGGLVHVYATFAANLFAVSAAFTALSNAADTTNMIKGLDQLGAASGTSLGKLSKDLVEATDGAISLREAMTATAQASAAGMSDANLKRLGAAARGASVALGVGMGDALSRLSRGITKLEPELLDELGVFVRVDKASEDYARTIGKSAATLTDFEKRQAFANAVLDQAQKKFGAIDIPANPYDKLLASFKNVAQGGLELANKVLGPLVESLAASPTALAASIGLIASVLLKQAIPAITQWKSALHDASAAALKSSKDNLELFQSYVDSNRQQAISSLSESVKAQGKAAEDGMSLARQKLKEGAKLYSKDFKELMKKDISQMSTADFGILDKTKADYTKRAEKAAAGTDPAAAKAADDRLKTFTAIDAELRKAITSQEIFDKGIKDTAGVTSLGLMGKAHQKLADDADKAHRKLQILANAADNATFSGPIAAYRAMSAAVDKAANGFSGFEKAVLKMRGTLTIAASAIGFLGSALGSVLSTVGLVVGAIAMLTSWLGKNDKEAAAASKALGDLDEAGQTMGRTLEFISRQDPLKALDLNGMAARAKAMESIGTNMVDAIASVDKEIQARNPIDKLVNGIYSIFGKGTEDKLTKELSASLKQAIEASGQTAKGLGFKEQIAGILGIEATSSAQEFADAMSNAGDATKRLIANDMQKFGKDINLAAQNSKALKDSFVELYKQYDDIVKAAANESPLARASVDAAKKLGDLSQIVNGDFEQGLRAVNEITNDPKFLRLVPAGEAQKIIDASDKFKTLETQTTANAAAIVKYTDELNTMQDLIKNFDVNQGSLGEGFNTGYDQQSEDLLNAYKDKVPQIQAELDKLKLNSPKLEQQFRSLAGDLNKSIQTAVTAQITEVYRQVTTALDKAKIATNKGYLEGVSGTQTSIALEASLTKQGLDIDIKNLKASENLILALANNTLALEAKTNLDEQAALQAKMEKMPKGTADYVKAQEELTNKQASQRRIDAIRTVKGGVSGVDEGYMKDLAKTDPGIANVLLPLQSQLGGVRAGIAGLEGQKVIADFQANLKSLQLEQTQKSKQLDDSIASIDNKIKLAESSTANPAELQEKTKAMYEERKLLELQQKNLPGTYAGKAADMTAAKFPDAKGAVAEVRKLADAAAKRAQDDADTAETLRKQNEEVKKINDSYTKSELVAAEKAKWDDLSLRAQEQTNSAASELLSIKNEQGLIDNNSYIIQKNALELDNLAIAAARTEIDLADKRRAALDALQKGKDEATARNDTSEVNRYNELLVGATKYYDAEYAYLQRSNEAKLKNAELAQYMSGRHEAYTKVIQSGFKAMEDAIVDFTKTGKLSFDTMIASMLEGLLRYEIQQQQTLMFASMGGAKGLAGSFLGMFSGTQSGAQPSGAVVGGPMSSPGGAIGTPLPGLAHGGAFDSGVMKFAKGGTFTNSIVSNPTLFKFAKGTGMMGEAGPEAIMPLKRDGQGNLGVRTSNQAPKVDIVVNNHSGQPATTRESTDSRGNRKIEVIVGDMVASEMSRPGSAAQNSVRSNFGVQPALVRR